MRVSIQSNNAQGLTRIYRDKKVYLMQAAQKLITWA